MTIEMEHQKHDTETEIVFKIRSGDVWSVNLERENGPSTDKYDRIGKIRPCIVLSDEDWNCCSSLNRVLVLPLSTQEPKLDWLETSKKSNLGIEVIQIAENGSKLITYPCFNRIQTVHTSNFVYLKGQLSAAKWDSITNALSANIFKDKSKIELLSKIEDLDKKVIELTDTRTNVILKDEMVSKLEETIKQLTEDNEAKLKTIVNLRNTIENLSKSPSDIEEPDKVVYSTGPDTIESFNSLISKDMYEKLSSSISEKEPVKNLVAATIQKPAKEPERKKLVKFNNGINSVCKDVYVSKQTERKLNTPNSRRLEKAANKPPVTPSKLIVKPEPVSTQAVVELKEEPKVKQKYDGLNTRSIKTMTQSQAISFLEYVDEGYSILEIMQKFNIKAYSTYNKLLPIIRELSKKK